MTERRHTCTSGHAVTSRLLGRRPRLDQTFFKILCTKNEHTATMNGEKMFLETNARVPWSPLLTVQRLI